MSIDTFATRQDLQADIEALAHAHHVLILSDYDGVIAPIAPRPEQAVITAEARAILERLAALPETTFVAVSGRDKLFMDAQLDGMDIEMSAEHGSFRKTRAGIWIQVQSMDPQLRADVLARMEAASQHIPGSMIEAKDTGLALHYREAKSQKAAEATADRLIIELRKLAESQPLKVIPGSKVVEAQPAGASKGQAAAHWLNAGLYDAVLGIGDDYTDASMLEAIAASPIRFKLTYGVGSKDISAQRQLANPAQVLDTLDKLATARRMALLGR